MSFLYQPWFGRKQTPRPLKKDLSQANRTNVERADLHLSFWGAKRWHGYSKWKLAEGISLGGWESWVLSLSVELPKRAETVLLSGETRLQPSLAHF
jgi:hypothetical protein